MLLVEEYDLPMVAAFWNWRDMPACAVNPRKRCVGGEATTLISRDMAIGIVSAVWALHACVLIWHGLVSSYGIPSIRRVLLFAVAVCKTVLVDAFNLAGVYRIISWLGVGILLVVAALLYQRYSAVLLAEDATNADDNSRNVCPGTPQDGI